MRNLCRIGYVALGLMIWPCLSYAGVTVETVKKSGMTAWLVEDHHIPALQMQITFKGAGYISDPSDQQGRAALAAAMLMEGTDRLDSAAFHRAMENQAIQISVDLGADDLVIQLKTLSQHADKALELLSSMLREPRLDARSLAQVKSRFHVSRLRQLESPSYQATSGLAQLSFPAHPYAQEKLGTDETAESVDTDAIRQFIADRLTRDRMVISVVGSIDDDQLERLMSTHLGSLPREAEKAEPIAGIALSDAHQSVHIAQQSPQTVWLFMQSGVKRSDPDFYAAYILNQLVGGGSGLTSRLAKAVREERGLTYGIATDLSRSRYLESWQGMVSTRADQLETVQRVTKEVIKDIIDKGFTEEEVERAKRYVAGSFPLQIDHNASIAAYLTTMQQDKLGADYLDKRNGYFEAVTVEQVNRLAREWLKPEQWKEVTVGPAPASPVIQEK